MFKLCFKKCVQENVTEFGAYTILALENSNNANNNINNINN